MGMDCVESCLGRSRNEGLVRSPTAMDAVMGCTGHVGNDDQICYCSECTIDRLTAELQHFKDTADAYDDERKRLKEELVKARKILIKINFRISRDVLGNGLSDEIRAAIEGKVE